MKNDGELTRALHIGITGKVYYVKCKACSRNRAERLQCTVKKHIIEIKLLSDFLFNAYLQYSAEKSWHVILWWGIFVLLCFPYQYYLALNI